MDLCRLFTSVQISRITRVDAPFISVTIFSFLILMTTRESEKNQCLWWEECYAAVTSSNCDLNVGPGDFERVEFDTKMIPTPWYSSEVTTFSFSFLKRQIKNFGDKLFEKRDFEFLSVCCLQLRTHGKNATKLWAFMLSIASSSMQ